MEITFIQLVLLVMFEIDANCFHHLHCFLFVRYDFIHRYVMFVCFVNVFLLYLQHAVFNATLLWFFILFYSIISFLDF